MKRTQLSLPLIFISGLLILFNFAMAFMFQPDRQSLFLWLILVPIAILIFFYRMVVEIDQSSVRIYFGIGWLTRKIPMTLIRSVTIVNNPLIGGWGIRIGTDYVLYNASGWGAIELTFKDNNTKVRIGCDDPNEVESYINQFLTN